MKRENFSQLPTSTELGNILDAEVKRELPEGKEDAHYIDFSPLIKLAEHFGISPELLVSNYTKEALMEEDLLEKGKSLIEQLKEKLLNKELTDEDLEVCNSAYDYLAEEDTPDESDLLFVFGAKTPLRIERAIELYNEGLADKLMVSGRSPHYANDEHALTEAEAYAQVAKEKGVPEGSIIMETDSITIPDNVRASLNLLDKYGVEYSSIILINSPYTQRRGWAHFKKYLPDLVRVIRVNSGTADLYKRESWYKNPKGIDVVLGEYLKAKVAVSLNTA